MNWNTVYVKGKCGFEEEVLYNLEHSSIRYMPGSASGLSNVSLYWLGENVSLRDFKKAIGSKTVFKYRLQFFNSLEEAEKPIKTEESFTLPEKDMIRRMADWERDHTPYKHSA